jgi:hypothetical protein
VLVGGLDTGIDFGKFMIDTSNNIGTPVNMASERFAERFIGPYARTHLNSPSLLKETESDYEDDDLASEQ